MESTAVTVERRVTERGELVLRTDAGHYEVISNGVFLMDTRAGRSERLLIQAALAAVPGNARLLIGGLGVGFSLAEAARSERVAEITVVEIEPALVAWHRSHLSRFSEHALDDPRVRVVTADIVTWLRGTDQRFDAICLDVDNGPDWTVFDGNADLYGVDGAALLRSRLRPGGVLAVWSAAHSPGYARRLAEHVGPVDTHRVEVPRGEPDVVYLAHAR
ncbi:MULTISPECIES: spermine/spermidine synthase domain-containing protein [Micromonospora]|uniref:spermine/spermidine synthase domain-containing protein n=1 Tax=Micromonospora TaxID=1873 RepID=UPI000D6F5C16|nr:spermidine synthase [Micromonospora sp. S4605]PWU52517.1 spermidine synthase [Micromonospora sp. S4605]